MTRTATAAGEEQASTASPAAEWTRTTRRELVSRVVQSSTFARSERLSALLTYVCDMTLKGRGAELNEQHIGHAVFGRKPDYDSSADGLFARRPAGCDNALTCTSPVRVSAK